MQPTATAVGKIGNTQAAAGRKKTSDPPARWFHDRHSTSRRPVATRSGSVDQPARYGRVAVNPAIPQKRPVAANVFQYFEVYFTHQNFFLVMGSLGDHSPEGITQERPTPEFQPSAGRSFT